MGKKKQSAKKKKLSVRSSDDDKDALIRSQAAMIVDLQDTVKELKEQLRERIDNPVAESLGSQLQTKERTNENEKELKTMANSTHNDRVSGVTEAEGNRLNVVTPEATRTASGLSNQERLANVERGLRAANDDLRRLLDHVIDRKNKARRVGSNGNS